MLTFIVLTLTVFASAQTYTREYHVMTDDEKIGQVTAIRTVKENVEHYMITCEMSVRMLLKVDISYKLEALYKQDVLYSSSAIVYLNDNVQDKVNVRRAGSSYVIVNDGSTEIITDPIPYTSAWLYYHLPETDIRIFSETDGTFKTLSKLNTFEFELTDPGNSSQVSTYTYTPGRGLLRIDIDRKFIPTFRLQFAGETVRDL